MRTTDLRWTEGKGLHVSRGHEAFKPQFVLFYGSLAALRAGAAYEALRAAFPDAQVVGAATAGQFGRTLMQPDVVTGVAVELSAATLKIVTVSCAEESQSFTCGVKLIEALRGPYLKAILTLSALPHVNASALVEGLQQARPHGVKVLGGLSGAAIARENSLLSHNGTLLADEVVAVGFYGENLVASTASSSGLGPMGVRRRITRAEGNVVYELDGEPAYDIYARYLGPEDMANFLGITHHYPFHIRAPDDTGEELIRSVVGINLIERSITFGGHAPQGWTAQLVRSDFKLIRDGAKAVVTQQQGGEMAEESVSLLVSCVGRRRTLGQRIIDEIEAIATHLPGHDAMVGFYSYGELVESRITGCLQFQNQTLAMLRLSEGRGAEPCTA